MEWLDEEKATFTTLDAGEVFIGGRYHSLVPIAQEVLDGGFKHYYAVAVLKKILCPMLRLCMICEERKHVFQELKLSLDGYYQLIRYYITKFKSNLISLTLNFN